MTCVVCGNPVRGVPEGVSYHRLYHRHCINNWMKNNHDCSFCGAFPAGIMPGWYTTSGKCTDSLCSTAKLELAVWTVLTTEGTKSSTGHSYTIASKTFNDCMMKELGVDSIVTYSDEYRIPARDIIVKHYSGILETYTIHFTMLRLHQHVLSTNKNQCGS